MVAVSGNTLVNGRPREHNGNLTEFKFVFKSYSGVVGRTTELVTLMSSLSKMRTGTTERSAAEFRLILMECGWVKSKNKEQGMEKDKSKGKGNENPKSEELTELRSNCRKWGHNDASGWHGKEKQVNRVRDKAGTVSLSSTLVATEVDTKKELGLIESESENAEKELAGYGRWVYSDQSVLRGLCDFRACVSEKLCHSRDFGLSKFGVCERWCTTRRICTAKCSQ